MPDPRPPILWFDITTSWHERGRRPNGTLRVERSYAREAIAVFGPRLRFCRYSRSTGRFLPVVSAAAETLFAAAPGGRRRPGPFAGRCEMATDFCRQVAPAIELKADGHWAACHYAERRMAA